MYQEEESGKLLEVPEEQVALEISCLFLWHVLDMSIFSFSFCRHHLSLVLLRKIDEVNLRHGALRELLGKEQNRKQEEKRDPHVSSGDGDDRLKKP